MSDFAPPFEQWGVRVSLAPLGQPREYYLTGDRPQFTLIIENPGEAVWKGRISIVWAQGTGNWAESSIFTIPSHTKVPHQVQSQWIGTTGTVECRLPTERSPLELTSLGGPEIVAAALASRYIVLGSFEVRHRYAVEAEAENRRRELTRFEVL